MENKSSAGVRFDMSSREMISERPASPAKLPTELRPASVTVVICCHNSAARLPETLRHLAQQKVPPELLWEILVIDNVSTDDTLAVINHFSSQHPNIAIRVVNEPQLGTGYARRRGIGEALHDIIFFVDDDNWLAPDYLAILVDSMKQHPEIAVLGGMSTADV